MPFSPQSTEDTNGTKSCRHPGDVHRCRNARRMQFQYSHTCTNIHPTSYTNIHTRTSCDTIR